MSGMGLRRLIVTPIVSELVEPLESVAVSVILWIPEQQSIRNASQACADVSIYIRTPHK